MERYALLWLFSTAVLLGLAVWRGPARATSPRRRDLLRAVGAVRRSRSASCSCCCCTSRSSSRASPTRTRCSPSSWACCSSASTMLEAEAAAARAASASAPGRADLTHRRADMPRRPRSRSSWSATTAPRELGRDARRAAGRSSAPSDELVVVDNASRDGTPDVVRARPTAGAVVEPARTSASPAAATPARAHARRRCCLFLNPDARAGPGCARRAARARRASARSGAPGRRS